MPQDHKKDLKFQKADDFRYHAVDAISAIMTDSSLKIAFGIEEEGQRVTSTVGLFMTHKTAGVLFAALRTTFERYESDTGRKFPVPDQLK